MHFSLSEPAQGLQPARRELDPLPKALGQEMFSFEYHGGCPRSGARLGPGPASGGVSQEGKQGTGGACRVCYVTWL